MIDVAGIRSRVPDPRTVPPLRWGVLGTGWIAERFIATVHQNTPQRFTAVGSRDFGRARDFATRHGIERAHGDYSALVGDPAVDVVYIATPHTQHLPDALLAIRAGKHVLVEKPLGIDAGEARTLADAARAAGVFCAEALWTAFLPRFDIVRQLLDSGVIGELRTVLAEYGEHLDDTHRAMDPTLAGGSLLDLGTYPVALASMLLGAPVDVHAVGRPNRFGVNEQSGALVVDESGAMAVLHTSLAVASPTTAVIGGTLGSIELGGPFYQPGDVVARSWEKEELGRWTEPAIGHRGLHWEASAVARAIAGGRTEADERPLAASIAFLELMDAIRDRAGIRFR